MIRYNHGSGFIAIVVSPMKAERFIKELIRFADHSAIFADLVGEIPERELERLKEEK